MAGGETRTQVQVQNKYSGNPNAANGNQYSKIGLGKASSLSGAELKSARYREMVERAKRQTIDLGGKGKEVSFGSIWTQSLSTKCKDFSLTSKKFRSTIPGVTEDPDPTVMLSEKERQQICEAPIAFEEQDYPARENDYRVFIEGVEVSGYVRGSASWTIETTGGMNTCRFDLNNNQDAFIITPTNVCSNLSLNGWRVDTLNLYSPSIHSEARYDELAKYLIYKKKFEKVAPGTGRADIDPESGMWYYPLPPMGLIFNQNDTVRVFRKLSHLDGAKVTPDAGAQIKNYDLWIPAFTGFIRSASYDDDYTGGDRVVHIECYDFRGLMEGMRVRTVGLPLGTGGPGSKGKQPVAKSVVDEALTSEFSCLTSTGNGIADLLNKIYESNFRRCQYETAKKNSSSTGTALTLLQLGACRLGAAAVISKDIPLSKELCKLFTDNAEEVKKLLGQTAALWLDAASPSEVVTWSKGSKGGESSVSTSAQSGGSPTNSNSTGSASTSGAPALTAPKAIDPKALTAYTADPKSAAGKKSLESGIPSPSISSSGDLELLDAMQTYLSNRPLYYLPAIPKEGDCSTYPQAIYADTTGSNGKKITETDLVNCCKLGVSGSLSGLVGSNVETGATTEGGVLKYGFCTVNGMRHLAALINKSVLNYAYTKLHDTTKSLIQQTLQGANANTVRDFPVMVTGTVQGLSATVDIDINVPATGRALRTAKEKINELATPYKKAAEKAAVQMSELKKKLKNQLDAAVKAEAQAEKSLGDVKYSALIKKQTEALDGGQKKADAAGIPNAGNLAELLVNEPTFDGRAAGLFADLIRKVGQGSHPLENMSYEVAVTWLCCAPTTGRGPGCRPGIKVSTWGSYNSMVQTLQEWNKRVLFGIAGRPLTFDEVTAIGKDSGSDAFNDPFTPYKPFLHIMLPPNGTGARTIVQQDLTSNTGNSTSFQYENRKSLVDRISTLLNYQWFVSPWGDIVFEFPNYNSAPAHWGETFKGAYTLDKEITGITVNEESNVLNTAWVITGMESTKEAQQAVSSQTAQNLFYKISIMCPILARRVGVRVEHISLEIPGVGGQISDRTEAGGVESLVAWGLLHIQRQLGEAHKVNIKEFPDRPYLLPNRPILVVPRQKICLTRSVTYTMDKPNGDATVSVDCGYTRWIYRDGTFRHIAGGKDQIIDYSGMFTGSVQSSLNRGGEGPRSKTFGEPSKQSQNKQETAWGCNSLATAAEAAQSFYGQEIASMGNGWLQYNGNTSGAAGLPGFIPLSSGLGSRYGSVSSTPAPNPASKTDGSIGATAAAAGLRVEGQKAKSPTYYNLKNLFLDPYPFGSTYTGAAMVHNYGFLKVNARYLTSASARTADGYVTRKGDLELVFHEGVDIFESVGKNITAPMDVSRIEVSISVGSNEKAAQTKKYVPITGDSIRFATTSPPTLNPKNPTELEVYGAPYTLWVESKAATGKSFPLKTDGGGAGGISIYLYGNVALPNSSPSNGMDGKNLYAKLVFRHCNSVMSGPDGYYGLEAFEAKAGDVIGTVGKTGTNFPHAHVEMYVAAPGSAADPSSAGNDSAYKEVQKANNEFLTTQLLLKVTGGKPDSKELSPEWKKYFREKDSINYASARGYGVITTPAEAVEYLLAYSNSVKGATSEAATAGGWTPTNPLLFFRPDQLVPSIKDKMDAKGWPPKGLSSYSTESFNSTILADTTMRSAVCGKLSQDVETKVKNNFTSCMLEAKAKATSSYSSYALAASRCRLQINKDAKQFNQEAKKKKEEEDKVKKLAAEQKRKQRQTKR